MNTSPLTKKQLAKLFKNHGINADQWATFNPAQQQALIVAGAVGVNTRSPDFIALGAEEPPVQFRDPGPDPGPDAAPGPDATPEPEPSVDDLGANTVGKRKSSGPRAGNAMGAKPHVRKLLGTANPDGKYPLMTMEDICHVTKKSQINIRTILSDLRSPKYCGTGGVFMTTSTKIDGKTFYQYVPS